MTALNTRAHSSSCTPTLLLVVIINKNFNFLTNKYQIILNAIVFLHHNIETSRWKVSRKVISVTFCYRSVNTLGVVVSRLAREDMAAMEGTQGCGLLIKLRIATTRQHQVVTRAQLVSEVEEVIFAL